MSLKNLIRGWFVDDVARALKNPAPIHTIGLEGPPSTNLTRQFNIHAALNGSYIEFTRRKYNPNGPDEFMREVYLVHPDDSLIDAISTVLVLTEK
jgi:hypothetical protein